MRSKLGIFLMLTGTLMLACAAGLLAYNHQQDVSAGEATAKVLPVMAEQITVKQESKSVVETSAPQEMPVTFIDDYAYVGCITIPSIDRELPVMADWSYPKLRMSPCRYSGSILTDDMVIAAHNYRLHFGPIHRLRPGDPVYFTDVDGMIYPYEVTDTEILFPSQVEELTSGEADLTLFTCTYGGEKRITVHCDRTMPEI